MIKGIDVSRHQGQIQWNNLPEYIKFAFIRASVGDYYTDPLFMRNWDACPVFKSAYHVVVPTIPAEKQLNVLFNMLDDRYPDLPIALDVELRKPLYRDVPPASVKQTTYVIRECADILEAHYGTKPIIYTGTWFWNPYVMRKDYWNNYDVWLADYSRTRTSPYLPKDWDHWYIWQYTSAGRISGIAGNVDINKINGELKLLNPQHPQ